MSDNVAAHFEKDEEAKSIEVQPQGRSVTLTVTLHPNGQIECNLPSNKILAHGLLGVAMEQLAKMSLMSDVQQQAKSSNGGGIDGLLKKMGRR